MYDGFKTASWDGSHVGYKIGDEISELVAEWICRCDCTECTQRFWRQMRDLHHSGQDKEAWALIVAQTLSRSNDAAG